MAQGEGYRRQSSAAAEQSRLLKEELDGQRGQYGAGVAQAREAAAEGRLQSLEASRTCLERTADDLREVDASLGDVLPRLGAARATSWHAP